MQVAANRQGAFPCKLEKFVSFSQAHVPVVTRCGQNAGRALEI